MTFLIEPFQQAHPEFLDELANMGYQMCPQEGLVPMDESENPRLNQLERAALINKVTQGLGSLSSRAA